MLCAFMFVVKLQIYAELSSDYCIKCHKHIYDVSKASEKGSHHFYANRNIDLEKDGAVFDGRIKKIGNVAYTFFKDGNALKIKMSEAGVEKVFEPKMVIGKTPLKQFIIEVEAGKFQTLSLAVDTNNNELFDVFNYEERLQGEWGHWLGRGMNWNSNCAYCHTTNYKKNYDFKSDSYKSAFIEQGIRCIECHDAIPKECMEGKDFLPVIKKRPTNLERTYSCAVCHSRREELTNNKFKVGDSYFDHFRPILPDTPNIYRADGQVMEENFMFGSFMMCRQFKAGVSCTDCHDAHSMRLVANPQDNKLCLNCHAPNAKGFKGAPTIDVKLHTFHDERGGTKCIDCHMPQTVYMGKDARYDHGFTSPDPYLTKTINIPNTCTRCHEALDKEKPERNLDWMIKEFDKRHLTERLKHKRSRAIALDDFHKNKLSYEHMFEVLRLLDAEELDAWRAILATTLTPYIQANEAYEKLKALLKDKSELVRSRALRALSSREDAQELAKPLLQDPSRLVRIDASCLFTKSAPEENIAELLEYLDFNTDSALGALKRADYAVNIGDTESVSKYTSHAQSLDKLNPDLKVEAALMEYRAGHIAEAEKIFEEAMKFSKNNPNTFYNAALFYAENKNVKKSAELFESCVRIDPNFSRAWYNLSIARLQLGEKEKAMQAINTALLLEPSNPEFINVKNYLLKN